MVKPRTYRNFRSLGCPRCGYGLVESRQSIDFLCPECGLTLHRNACPPEWSIEIGPRFRLASLASTLKFSFLPGLIVDAVVRPTSIVRPYRALLIPLVSLSLLHSFIVLLACAAGTSAPAWPYSTSQGIYLLTRVAADIPFQLIVLGTLILNTWIALAFGFGFTRNRPAVTALRLWSYAVPPVAVSAGCWLLIRTIVLNNYYQGSFYDPFEVIVGLFVPLGSSIALAVTLLLVGALWWGCMAAALSVRGPD